MIELQIKSSFEQMCFEWAFKKLLIDLLCLISLGSLFQSYGAALQNALSPYDRSLVLGSTNYRLSWARDLRLHGLLYTVIKLHMYSGALLWRALKVSRSILKLILNLTGSQCNWTRTGIICSNLWVICQPNFVHIEAL